MTEKWHGGKGSRPRPLTDSDAYAKNWEKIFNNRPEPREKPKEKK